MDAASLDTSYFLSEMSRCKSGMGTTGLKCGGECLYGEM